MHPASIVVFFLCHVWSTSALPLPCDTWSPGETNNVYLSHPAEEEIILLTFSEDSEDDDDGGEKPYPISMDILDDHRLSGEVVESATSKGLSSNNVKSDSLPLNVTEGIPQQTHSSVVVDTDDEDDGLTTTESVKVD